MFRRSSDDGVGSLSLDVDDASVGLGLVRTFAPARRDGSGSRMRTRFVRVSELFRFRFIMRKWSVVRV